MNTRCAFGQLGAVTARPTESLEIDTMQAGEIGSSKPAAGHPIVRIRIIPEEDLGTDRTPLTLARINARPAYGDTGESPATEEDLEEALIGYSVSVEISWPEQWDEWPAENVDWDDLGFGTDDDDPSGTGDFAAHYQADSFTEAIQAMKSAALELRNIRES